MVFIFDHLDMYHTCTCNTTNVLQLASVRERDFTDMHKYVFYLCMYTNLRVTFIICYLNFNISY